MNFEELNRIVIAAIQHVAPEIEGDTINPDNDLREECDIDSMDFLNFLAALKNTTGINIPEADYPRVNTLNKMLEYLNQKLN